MWGQTNKAKARKLAKYQQLDLIYRAKLRKLGQKRYGTHYLPDNAEGRAMLQARFHYEMTLEDGREYAPWADDRELRTLQHVGRRMKRNNLGPLINLTDDEREAFKMWLLSPCDVSEEELERRRINKRKESWRRSKQKARDKLRQAAQEVKQRHAETVKERPLTKDDERQAAILDMLAHAYEHPRGQGWDQHTWRTVSELTAKAKRCEAFVRVGCHPLVSHLGEGRALRGASGPGSAGGEGADQDVAGPRKAGPCEVCETDPERCPGYSQTVV